MILSNKNKVADKDSFTNSLIMTAMRLEALTERYFFKPAGVSSASFKMLAFIKNNNKCSPSSILNYIGGTKSNITQRLGFLEREGLISSQRPNKGDKRTVLLNLTASGILKFDEVLNNIVKSRVHIERFFTKTELRNHFAFMSKLDDTLNKCEDIMKCHCVKSCNK